MSDLSELYQELILDHNKSPRNHRELDQPDGKAEGFNPLCGDRITVYVNIADDIVQDVTFQGSGCAISTASASLMTQSLKGKTVAEAKALFGRFHGLVTGNVEELEDSPGLGKLTAFAGVCDYPARVKCATLAWHTVKAALDNSEEIVTTE